ncbi:MAG: T9SS type A sorting domain-containing protein, partial [Prevotellaceae bacterium]|nr:T9SS type A sorting domain-containing protein [Prevotellaceae bacterium]
KIDVSGTTSVKKDELSFTLYPNPFTNELYISSDEDVESVQLVSLQGTVVLTQHGVSVIPTSQIPNGMYILKVQSKQGKVGAKLVLKK